MKHCHFTILYNEIDFLRLKMPFLYEHFDQLIFYDLLVFGNERKFSNDGSHEFIKNYPDPENKITLIEETNLDNVEPLGESNVIKQKMFSYGSTFVDDDVDVFWCTDIDEFFKEELIAEVESIFKRSVNSIGTKFYNFYKTPEFLLTYNKELYISPGEHYSVRIVRHKPGNKYGHCDIGKNYKPINLTTKNALYHLSWVGEKRVREKFSYYKDNPVTGFVSVKYIKEWEEFSEAKFNALNKRGFYGNPFVGPGRFERTQVTKCPFDLFEELPYLDKAYINSMIRADGHNTFQIIKKPIQPIKEEVKQPIKIIEDQHIKIEDIKPPKNIKNFFSIIIPTMWRSEKILEMLPIYERCPFVKEVIIIDNDPLKTPDLKLYKKIRYYTKGENIYVNPAWNWGYSLSNYNTILANDDIVIYNLNEVLQLIGNSDYDIVGLDLQKDDTKIRIDQIDKFPERNFGCFMYIKNYVYIPDNLKIWYGDYVIFYASKKRGVLKNINIDFTKSQTVDSDINLFRNKIGKNDIEIYNSLTKFDKDINIIIRTSGRPIYFYNCIKSIKKSGINAKLHIAIDNLEDLKYVHKTCEGLDYVYYLMDKEVIENICRKIKIERNLFIYNYYFNVIKPYLNGWCIVLDDDDEILMNPVFEKNKDNIYLFKADVGHKIVPIERNFGKKPVLNDISSLSIIWHSSQMVDWKPQRGGDYDFISELYEKYPSIWSDKILSKVQTKGNFGKRNDLKDKPISVNLATFPPRKKAFIKCINNLLSIDVIDTIRVYLNEYKEIPDDFPKNDKILYFIGKENLKDSGKFYWAQTYNDEYYFTADDDLIYPKEYFIEHLLLLYKYNNDIFVSLHGKEMKEKPSAFNDYVKTYHYLQRVRENVWINNPGTGVMVFDNSKFAIPLSLFKYHGMADLWISYYCQHNKIPILCRKHDINELRYLLDKEETLFDRRNELNKEHQKILEMIGNWNLYKK